MPAGAALHTPQGRSPLPPARQGSFHPWGSQLTP